MNSRDTILKSIRDSLSDLKNRPESPPVPEVWSLQNLSQEAMQSQFGDSLVSVLGEFVPCSGIEDAAAKIETLLREIDAKEIGVLDRPLAREVAEKLSPQVQRHFAPENPDELSSETLASWDASLLAPEFLLADTGSCLFKAPIAFDRLLCYIVPLAIVVASKEMLREHLPHAWTELEPQFGSAETLQSQLNAQTSGEFLIMTGPSRTADIEKVLILGVHGPKRVVVFLVD